jgi:hypothetical protein
MSMHDCQFSEFAAALTLLNHRTALLSSDGRSTRIPCYWLHVLRGTDTGALAITRRDAAVLAHLADVRYHIQVPERPGAAGQPQEVTAKCKSGATEWPLL